MTMQVLMLRNRMVDGVLLASGSTQTVSDEDGAYLVANEWATRTDGVPDRVITSDVSVPTIDPTTGALINPVTGGPISIVMLPTDVLDMTPAGPFTAAASATQASGIVGTMLSTPTQADTLSKMVRVDVSNCRSARIALNDTYATKAAGPLWVVADPGDDVTAAGILAARSNGAIRVLPGEARLIGVDSAADDLAAFYLAHEYASGAGYTDISSTIEAYSVTATNQLTMRTQADVLSGITSDFIYFPGHESSGTLAEDRGNVLANDTYTVAGTTTNLWTNRGYFTCAGDNSIAIKTQEAVSFGNLSTLDGAGGFLMAMRWKTTTLQSASDNVFMSFGSINTAAAGFEVTINNSAAKLRLNVRHPSQGSSTTYQPSATFSTGVVHHALIYIDCIAKTMQTWIDGSLYHSANLTYTDLPAGNTTNGICFLARAGASATVPVNSNSGNHICSDLFAMRCEYDAVSSIPSLAAAWARIPFGLPSMLRGM